MANHTIYPPLTAARLRELLHYNPKTGQFRWLQPSHRRARYRDKVGTEDTTPGGYTYLRIGIDCRVHKAHRLAWLYMTGAWPTGSIDHINRKTLDNRWINLRDATRSTNKLNHGGYKNNKSGVTGVYFHTSGKYRWWTAEFRRKYLGCFRSKSDAIRAAQEARRQDRHRCSPDGRAHRGRTRSA